MNPGATSEEILRSAQELADASGTSVDEVLHQFWHEGAASIMDSLTHEGR